MLQHLLMSLLTTFAPRCFVDYIGIDSIMFCRMAQLLPDKLMDSFEHWFLYNNGWKVSVVARWWCWWWM